MQSEVDSIKRANKLTLTVESWGKGSDPKKGPLQNMVGENRNSNENKLNPSNQMKKKPFVIKVPSDTSVDKTKKDILIELQSVNTEAKQSPTRERKTSSPSERINKQQIRSPTKLNEIKEMEGK